MDILTKEISPQVLALAAAGALGTYTTYYLAKLAIEPLFSPLRRLPGPPNPNFIWGHFKLIDEADTAVLHEKWTEQYGHTFVYNGPVNGNRLYSMDHKAVAHFLNRTDIYQKSAAAQRVLIRLLGEGLLVAEGETHKRQRRVLNPAFAPNQIRALTGTFLSKANELRDTLLSQVVFETGPATVDISSWLSKATLDIIGLAGFNYRFDSLTSTPESPNELNAAFSAVFSQGFKFTLLGVLSQFIPILLSIPTKRRRLMERSMSIMNRIGRQLVSEKKTAVLASTKSSGIEKAALQDRDLLSILVRANMATDLPPSQRLSDEEILAQIPTFLAAGHETTSSATTWALHSLSLNPEFQARLRAELQAFHLPQGTNEEPLDAGTLNALNALPLLDATIRETLRIWAPVVSTFRMAVTDDVVPLSTPITDRHGVLRDSVQIQKGDIVMVPVLAINRSKDIWGEDAHEWKPDRWISGVPSDVSTIPGIWANILSFIAGPHACIGYRFSIIETKILLHALLTNFTFRPAAQDIIRKSGLVSRPHVKSEPEKGSQLPLIVERVTDVAE